ncbi:MAG: type II toxin-antitoxin system VapC family toxin [Bacillota bacterium]|nr:type II toxin-antitoxin system VapC family toxin [Bacillota bacterium]
MDGVISQEEFLALKATFLGDVGDGVLEIVELTPAVIVESVEIAARRYVTPLDAVQLASALSLPGKPVLVCADRKLARLAGEYGLTVLDPGRCEG